MKVTYHATKIFLERVMKKVKYINGRDVYEVRKYLEETFNNVVPLSYARPFVLPIHKEKTVITIILK